MKIKIDFRFVIKEVAILGLAIFLLFPSLSLANYRGCCSYHGGIDYCDSSVGRLVCNDGTYSPSCTCPKATPTYVAPKPTPIPPVCTINGINYYSENSCRTEEHKEGIRRLYSSLLVRNATEDEVNFWASSESDIKKIELEILHSDEYKRKHPPSTLTVAPTPSPISNNYNDIMIWIGLGLVVVLISVLIGYLLVKYKRK